MVSSSDAGFIIKVSAEASADKAVTWKAPTTPAQWWSGKHTWSGDPANLYIDSQATGCFCEKLPRPKDAPEGQRMGSVQHMHIVDADPQAGMLRMTGGLGPLQSDAVNGTLTIRLKSVGEGTRIEWTYVVGGFVGSKGGDLASAVDQVLAEQLGRLAERRCRLRCPPMMEKPKARTPTRIDIRPGAGVDSRSELP